eukprot:g4598.t1
MQSGMTSHSRKRRCTAAEPSVHSVPESLDDSDPPVNCYLPSVSISHDLYAIKVCLSLLEVMSRVNELKEGRYAEEKPGSDVFEVKRDSETGCVEVIRSHEKRAKLEKATKQARKNVSEEMMQRKKDISALEIEIQSLSKKIQESDDGDDVSLVDETDTLSLQIGRLNLMIGRHKKRLKELQSLWEVEAKVDIDRVVTRVTLGSKETRTTTNESRQILLHNPCLYVMGGNSAADIKSGPSTLGCYDSEADSWDLAPVPKGSKRWRGAALVAANRKLYAIGGFDGVSTLKTMERYDPRHQTWEQMASMKTERAGFAAAVANGKIYVAGGRGTDNVVSLATVTVYDLQRDRWEDAPSMSCRRWCAAGAVLDEHLYIVGGRDGHSVWSSAERLDLRTNRWEALASMRCQRHRCAAVMLNGQLYVMGGSSENGAQQNNVLNLVEGYDPKTNRWTTLASMNHKRCGQLENGGVHDLWPLPLYRRGGVKRNIRNFGDLHCLQYATLNNSSVWVRCGYAELSTICGSIFWAFKGRFQSWHTASFEQEKKWQNFSSSQRHLGQQHETRKQAVLVLQEIRLTCFVHFCTKIMDVIEEVKKLGTGDFAGACAMGGRRMARQKFCLGRKKGVLS